MYTPEHPVDLTSRPAISSRRLADEDDELSEVQPDAVPPEVREWLASTFTRQLATTRRKADEKPKFRSVAHAIRAGIFVDRIYRRVTNTALMQFPQDVVKVLKVIPYGDRTILAFCGVTNGLRGYAAREWRDVEASTVAETRFKTVCTVHVPDSRFFSLHLRDFDCSFVHSGIITSTN